MRGKSSPPKSRNGRLEIENLAEMKEPHLSGAYIRSLVKQLTSSRTKDSSHPKEHQNSEGKVISSGQTERRCSCDTGFSDQKPEKSHHPPQKHKKQVRRKLHTSRPKQERLLNMAEARREIVTALKFHRASMKRASEKQQQQHMETEPETQPFEPSPHQLSLEQETPLKSRRTPRIYASNSSVPNNFPFLEHFSYPPEFCAPDSGSVSPPVAPPLLVQENFNFSLPTQTLGLNLNLQDFTNLDTTAFRCSTNGPSSIFSSSSLSGSSSPLSATSEEIPCIVAPPSVVAVGKDYRDSGLHPAMDDKEMAEIRSIGERHQIEWNDTMNLLNSAWWFKFLKAMEIEAGEDFVNSPPFDEVMEFPAWCM